MQVLHQLTVRSTPQVQVELAKFGIVAPEKGVVTFEVDEENSSWPPLKAWALARRAADSVSTRFLPSEIDGARWLKLVPSWHHGYPQPDTENLGFLRATYDLADYCKVCGVGHRQNAPFQIKQDPKWGRNEILQLNWVFEEYFVTPNLWTEVFAPNGIGCRPVSNTKGVELKAVVQLVIEERVDIVEEGLPAEDCAKCGRRKYLPVAGGFFPALQKEPTLPLVKTAQFFGSGTSGQQNIIIRQDLWRKLAARKTKGVNVRPVRSATL